MLVKLFLNLHKDPNAAQYLPKQVPWRACDFYRLKNPVPLVGEDAGSSNFSDVTHEVREACLQESNRVLVNPMNIKVQDLAEELSEDHIYLVIQIPDRTQLHPDPLDAPSC